MAEIGPQTPAMEPPDGQVSNFDDPPNENDMAIAILSILIFISTTVVALRLWTRFAIIREQFFGDCKPDSHVDELSAPQPLSAAAKANTQ